MTEPAPSVPTGRDDNLRTMSIVVYLLYLAALVNGVTGLIGLFIAYIKRDDARGTVYASHFENAIESFWLLVLACVGMVLLFWTLLIFPLAAVIWVWVIFRTVKGLIRASEGRPYYD